MPFCRDTSAGAARAELHFILGDCVLLVAVSTVAVTVMHMAHELRWGFVLECVAGMAGAMAAQMLLALIVTPLLGSIESMTPSMVVGMLSPMSICALHLSGWTPDWPGALALGGVCGIAMFTFVRLYARVARRRLERTFTLRDYP